MSKYIILKKTLIRVSNLAFLQLHFPAFCTGTCIDLKITSITNRLIFVNRITNFCRQKYTLLSLIIRSLYHFASFPERRLYLTSLKSWVYSISLYLRCLYRQANLFASVSQCLIDDTSN